MYARRVGDHDLTFDFAEGLINDNLLIVDRETNSVWSQLHGRAVMGPLEGTPLTVIPSLQTTWKFWRERYPDTRVMIFPGETGRPYLYRNPRPGLRPQGPQMSHDTRALGLGLATGEGDALFLPFRELDRTDIPLHTTLGGRPITIYYHPDAMTAWAEDAEGNLVAGVLAYESGWNAFHPQGRSYKAPR